MTANKDFRRSTVLGSVFNECNFGGGPPPWAVEEGRLAAAKERFASMPDGEVPLPGELPAGSWLPHAWNPLFVGREAELRAVGAVLRGAPGAAAALCPPVGLQGMGGVGKSQLAVEFAHRYGPWFAGGVFWLDCAEPASLDAQVVRLGAEAALEVPERFAAMPLAEQCATVWRLWRSGMPRLLVFDNCEDDALLATLRPKQGGCRVLVTSRRSEFSAALGLRPVRVEALPRKECLRLLAQFRPDLSGRAGLDAIAEELGDLPLALHLAGSFLRENRFDAAGEPTAYLAALRADGLDHASLIGALGASGIADELPTKHDRNVALTFALSWNRLDPAEPVDALARQAMACAAWLAPRVPIPRDLLARAMRLLATNGATPTGSALMRLLALGLVVEEPGGGVSLHRLVAAFAAARTGDPAGARDACGAALFAALAAANRTGLPARGAPLLPHAEWFLGAVGPELASNVIAGVLHELGNAERMRGAYGAARARFERALAILEALLGPDHPDVAIGLNNLGSSVLREQGDLAGCEAALRAGAGDLEWRRSAPNTGPWRSGSTISARVLREQGDLAGAKQHYQRALPIFQGVARPRPRGRGDRAQQLRPRACGSRATSPGRSSTTSGR